MAVEQQVQNTQQQPQQVNVSGTENTEQVQSTVQQPTDQAGVVQSVDKVQRMKDILSKDPSQLTAEEIIEVKEGYKKLQGEYTQKAQEASDFKKQSTDYDALIQRPDFIQWAASKQAQVSQQQPPQTQESEDEKVANMTEQERINYYVQKQIAPIAQTYAQDRRSMQDKELAAKYGEAYSKLIPTITQTQYTVAKNPYLYPEEAFKILDYEAAQQRAKEIGRQEALQGKVQRQNANMVQENAPSSTQREVIRGPGAIQKIWERAEKEGRTA